MLYFFYFLFIVSDLYTVLSRFKLNYFLYLFLMQVNIYNRTLVFYTYCFWLISIDLKLYINFSELFWACIVLSISLKTDNYQITEDFKTDTTAIIIKKFSVVAILCVHKTEKTIIFLSITSFKKICNCKIFFDDNASVNSFTREFKKYNKIAKVLGFVEDFVEFTTF